jgi:membrane associated rhomboid family serine protease
MSQSAPLALATIVVTAIISFIAFSSPQLIRDFAISPRMVLREGRWYQMITSGFLHAGIGHLFVNMFTLFFFGPPMERVLGTAGFLVLYLGSMFCGSLGTIFFHGADPTYRAVGASGAVSGVVFGYVLFRPFASLYLMLIPIPIPAIIFAIGYVAISIYGSRTRMGGIGHAAHLGGAIGGIILTIILYPRVISIFLSHFGL